MEISAHDAKDRLDELLDRARAGESVVIAQPGKAPIRLTPAPLAPLEPNGAKLTALYRSGPRAGFVQKTPEEIEAIIQEERDAWD